MRYADVRLVSTRLRQVSQTERCVTQQQHADNNFSARLRQIMLLIFRAAGFGMCSNGAFPTSWSRHIDLAAEVWQSMLRSSITRRCADALIEKRGLQSVSHTLFNLVACCKIGIRLQFSFGLPTVSHLCTFTSPKSMNTTHASSFGQQT